jgi:putative hydrolase
MTEPWDNRSIADSLLEMADLLEQQRANPFRVNAYRKAARTIAAHSGSVADLAAREGLKGLDALPAVGPSIGHAILEMLDTGRWMQLERLRGALDPEKVFQSVPGIGPGLAHRIHEELDIETLAGLEQAAHDGRLQQVHGVGPRRSRMIAGALGQMLQRRPQRARAPRAEPAVDVLLDVDREYREKARQGRLRKITPRRFNPEAKAWLPILHAQRGDWHFTALYSNTARAHELHKTDDWVVLFFHSDHGPESQRTVVTETAGRLRGQRIVRGREDECAALFPASRTGHSRDERTLQP